MIGQKNLLTACFAALLALGLAACGTTGDDAAPAAMMDDDGPPGMSGPELTELELARKAAEDAAKAADDFAEAAETVATNAADAVMGRAWFQTTSSSYAHAADAKDHAGYARTAAVDARTAADKAAATTTITVAAHAQLEAEAARDSAETHGGHVTDFNDDALAAAENEVFVVEGGHKVGDTTIMTGAARHSVTDDGQTMITGKQADIEKMNVGEMPGAAAVAGVMAVEAQPDANPPVDEVVGVMAVAYVQAVEGRPVNIGTERDSVDDTARLRLVTAYAGSRMVPVYATETGVNLTGLVVGNRIDRTPDDDMDDDFVTLKAVGMFYLAGPAAGADVGDNGLNPEDDEVALGAQAAQVFSYEDPDNAGVTIYVVLESSQTILATDRTTVVYQRVDITGNRDGVDTTPEQRIQARLADPTDYKHMNFGVWAGLGEAAKDGKQAIADLGVGFVQSIGDVGVTTTDDMPNHGDAKYNGDWVAAVQEEDPDGNGPIALLSGAAELMANFEKGDFTAMLVGLATLKGDITGNTFHGYEVSDIDRGDLDPDADNFIGNFNGGFFGSGAAEAGGVFAFATEDNEGGAFTGAFGGRR